MSFKIVDKFEKKIANYFSAPFAIATDSCTHAIELCLIYTKAKKINVPLNTYLSIPMLASKLDLKLEWRDEKWNDYYYVTKNIIDGAVYWKKNGYIKKKLICLSFQFKKHINIGRGGIILTDSLKAKEELIRLSYDGRDRNLPWHKQNIKKLGYHYYLTPESASLGIEIFNKKKNIKPIKWSYENYPNLKTLKVFKQK